MLLSSLPMQAFNILCEYPETVAAFLVPRARSVVARGQAGAAIRYLTPARALAKLLTAPLNIGKYFDGEGECSASTAGRLLLRQRCALLLFCLPCSPPCRSPAVPDRAAAPRPLPPPTSHLLSLQAGRCTPQSGSGSWGRRRGARSACSAAPRAAACPCSWPTR